MKNPFKKICACCMVSALAMVFSCGCKAAGETQSVRALKYTGIEAIKSFSVRHRVLVPGLNNLADEITQLESDMWEPSRYVVGSEAGKATLREIHYNMQVVRCLHNFFLKNPPSREVYRQMIVIDGFYRRVYRTVNEYINCCRTPNDEYLNEILRQVLVLVNRYLLFRIGDDGVITPDETFNLKFTYQTPSEPGQRLLYLCRPEIV